MRDVISCFVHEDCDDEIVSWMTDCVDDKVVSMVGLRVQEIEINQ